MARVFLLIFVVLSLSIPIHSHAFQPAELESETAEDLILFFEEEEIEVIRGPGSALHGANAFSAVINVVTKDGEDMDGIIATAGRGSFDTDKINLQGGAI